MSAENGREGREWPQEKREEAVRAYIVTGECEAAGKLCGLTKQTISTWRLHSPWWDELVLKVSLEMEEKYRAGWRGVLSGALDVMAERLENGNPVLRPDGSLTRVPVPAKDAIVIAGIAQDKLRLSLGLPSRIVAREADDDRMSKLRKAAEQDRAGRKIDEKPADGLTH